MTTNQSLDELTHATVYDRDGDRIGSVGQLYLDDTSDRPTWVTVHTGLFGTRQTFVPLADATISGEEIRVPYAKSLVKDAPHVEVDQHLTPAEEAELYRHYGLSATGQPDANAPEADQPRLRQVAVAEQDVVEVPGGEPIVVEKVEVDEEVDGPTDGPAPRHAR